MSWRKYAEAVYGDATRSDAERAPGGERISHVREASGTIRVRGTAEFDESELAQAPLDPEAMRAALSPAPVPQALSNDERFEDLVDFDDPLDLHDGWTPVRRRHSLPPPSKG